MRHTTMPDVVMKLMEGRARVAKGWCQGEFSLPIPDNLGGPKYCALGAVLLSNTDYAQRYELKGLLARALPEGRYDVASYNDAKGRTQADILALFDRAIAEVLRAGEWKPVSDAPGAIKEWVDAR